MNEELIFSKHFLTHFCKEQFFFSSNQLNRLDTYTSKSLIEQLKSLNIDNLHQDEEKIAFWINLYNGLLLYLIQIKKITDSKFSLKKNLFFQTFSIGNWSFSLNQIAKGILLNNIKPPSNCSGPFVKAMKEDSFRPLKMILEFFLLSLSVLLRDRKSKSTMQIN